MLLGGLVYLIRQLEIVSQMRNVLGQNRENAIPINLLVGVVAVAENLLNRIPNLSAFAKGIDAWQPERWVIC